MINQLLFGDQVTVLEEIPNWVKISSIHDNYEGWCETDQLNFTQQEAEITEIKLVDDITATFSSKNSQLIIPFSSTIPLSNGTLNINNELYKLTTGKLTDVKELTGENIVSFASFLINSPYLWGGRSPFGIDCSGLNQIVFKMVGYPLPRDAWQQAEHKGEFIDLIDQAKSGDVAFFDNEEGRIIHTGILTGDGYIIHANGRVRIDHVDHYGIFNQEKRSYSHKLRFIKRFGTIN